MRRAAVVEAAAAAAVEAAVVVPAPLTQVLAEMVVVVSQQVMMAMTAVRVAREFLGVSAQVEVEEAEAKLAALAATRPSNGAVLRPPPKVVVAGVAATVVVAVVAVTAPEVLTAPVAGWGAMAVLDPLVTIPLVPEARAALEEPEEKRGRAARVMDVSATPVEADQMVRCKRLFSRALPAIPS